MGPPAPRKRTLCPARQVIPVQSEAVLVSCRCGLMVDLGKRQPAPRIGIAALFGSPAAILLKPEAWTRLETIRQQLQSQLFMSRLTRSRIGLPTFGLEPEHRASH